MFRRNVLNLAVLSACACFAVSACAEGTSTVKIGFAGPLTGFSAQWGKDEENAVRVAVDDANKAGLVIGGKKVQFEVDAQDDAADPKTAVLVAQKFVDDEVAGIVGHHNSGCWNAAAPIYSKAGIPTVSPAASSPQITAQGYKTVFRTINNDDQMAKLAADYSVKKLGAKRIATIDDSTDYGSNFATELGKAIKADGGDVVSRQYTDTKSVDFRGVLTQIKGQNPDLIIYIGSYGQAAALVKQVRQLGITAKFMGEGGFTNDSFLKLAGDGAKGMYSWEYGLPLSRMPRAAELDTKLKAKFGTGIVQFAPQAYDATWAIINAMKKADSTDPKKYLSALQANSFDGIIGKIAFQKNGDLAVANASLFQEQGGKWAILDTTQGGSARADK
ncbi:extracellular ligand-binding receptor [Caballeronia arvi]|uniref:Extracellular ligand-binding receptor n=1 Tax=Caballeronia arvi TaxID=1777135 RepID=A0A158KJ49_9BURK|nr:branched-chain amino acid ABC transporter substrate-binding protein [Caballeronia arvi]SAL81127.1 extracellular ligand-binding receptor [Caballeronia arvi]